MSNQNSDAGGDKSNETPKPETQAEVNTRADVRAGITDYTESVKTQRAERKISGVSSATGAGADKDGKGGLASAKDLLGEDAHGITKTEKQAALMAQIARDGYIVGQKADTVLELAQKPKDDAFTKFKNTFEHPGRNDPDAGVDYASARDAYQRFGFENYGIDKDLLGAVLRNEQYWLNAKDVAQDYITEHRPFMLPLKDSWTVGPGQVQVQIMDELVKKYADKLPEFHPSKQAMTVGGMDVGERPADVAMLCENKKNAALIVGAYFADVVDKLEKGQPPCAHGATKEENDTITKLWKTGTQEARQEALIRSFNPGDGKKHVENVLKHLAEIKKHERQSSPSHSPA